jgi:hypothetical protein
MVAGRLVVELKAVPQLLPIHVAQVISYLKATGKPLGLLLNFHVPVLHIPASSASSSPPTTPEPGGESLQGEAPQASKRLSELDLGPDCRGGRSGRSGRCWPGS